METILWILGTAVILLFLGVTVGIEDNNELKEPAEEKDIFRIRFF